MKSHFSSLLESICPIRDSSSFFPRLCRLFCPLPTDIGCPLFVMNSQPAQFSSIEQSFCFHRLFSRMLHQTVAKRFVERRKSSFIPADPQMTLVVLGATKVTKKNLLFSVIQVGKSAMVSQFLWKGFDPVYTPTVEEFHWIEYDRGQDNIFTLQVNHLGLFP